MDNQSIMLLKYEVNDIVTTTLEYLESRQQKSKFTVWLWITVLQLFHRLIKLEGHYA